MNNMTLQEMYDVVVVHLYTQNKRAANEVGCVYLAADGSKCAVGVLIPDGHPAQQYMGGIHDMLIEFPDLGERRRDELGMLAELQDVHDAYSSWDDDRDDFAHTGFNAEFRLRDIAQSYNLDETVLDLMESLR